MLEETLPASVYKGFLDQAEVVTLSLDQKANTKTMETTKGQSTSTATYTKPYSTEIHLRLC